MLLRHRDGCAGASRKRREQAAPHTSAPQASSQRRKEAAALTTGHACALEQAVHVHTHRAGTAPHTSRHTRVGLEQAVHVHQAGWAGTAAGHAEQQAAAIATVCATVMLVLQQQRLRLRLMGVNEGIGDACG